MLRRIITLFFIGFFTLSIFSDNAYAQQEDQDLDTIEAEINTGDKSPNKGSEKSLNDILGRSSDTGTSEGADSTAGEGQKPEQKPEVKIENISDLSKLSEFSDVSVMQRRYMPKTGRFQMNVGLSSMVNDPWYTSMGANLRAAFGLTEQWGIEGQAFFMSTSQSVSAQELYGQHTIQASQSFGSLRSYYGAHVMWTPVYGKLSLFNLRIIPFDMYFTLGGGTSNIDGGTTSTAPTFSLGTGQIYALTRSAAFRWDLSLNSYQVTNGTVNNLLLTFGASFYIPEASYR